MPFRSKLVSIALLRTKHSILVYGLLFVRTSLTQSSDETYQLVIVGLELRIVCSSDSVAVFGKTKLYSNSRIRLTTVVR